MSHIMPSIMPQAMRTTIKQTVKQTIRYARLALLLLLHKPYLLQAAPAAVVATTSAVASVGDSPQKNTPANTPAVVSLNQASAEQLATQLKGIGRKRAQAIVQYRETHGPFITLEQLAEVPGISSSMLEQNRQRLTL